MRRSPHPIPVRIYSAFLFAAARAGSLLLSRGTIGSSWHLPQRLGITREGAAGTGPCVWLHGASMGECRLLLRMLPILCRLYPEDRFVLTSVTATGRAVLRSCGEARVIRSGLFPLDVLGLMDRMVAAFGIRRVWLMELEMWPSLISVCRRRGIPVGIVNARMERNACMRYRMFSFLFRPLFAHLGPVVAQNGAYARRFVSCGVAPGNVRIGGNVKLLESRQRIEPADRADFRRRMRIDTGDIVFTVGCAHPGEGRVVRDALALLRESDVPVKCIVVPRHCDRAAQICSELPETPLRLPGLSAGAAWDVCCIEAYGVLDECYANADCALVGGTFVSVGGHNVWEAARYGIPVFFGPRYETQRDGCTLLMNAGIGFRVSDGEALGRRLIEVVCRGGTGFEAARDRFWQTRKQKVDEWQAMLG